MLKKAIDEEVYTIILVSAISATAGALLHHLYDIGGLETTFNFILFIWWISYLDSPRQFYLSVCLVACAMFFGTTVGPIINCFAEVEQRSIVFFFGGHALIVCFHLFAICSGNMRVIYTINLLILPLFMSSLVFAHVIVSQGTFFSIHIPLNIQTVIPFVVSIPILWYVGYLIFRTKPWICGLAIPLHIQWLTVLAFSFHYNLLHLMCIYMLVVFGVHNLKLHTFDCSQYDLNVDRPFTFILTFYTEFFGRSSYILLFSGQTLVEYIWIEETRVVFNDIWNKICMFCVKQRETGLTVYRNALEAGRALLCKVKVYIGRLILISITVGVLSVLLFMFLASKVKA